MSNIHLPRCPHGQNPRACLVCFRTPAAQSGAGTSTMSPGGMVITNPPHVQRALDRAAGRAMSGQRVDRGEVPRGDPEVVPKEKPRAPQRPQPVDQGGYPAAPPEARTTAHQPWRTNAEGIEEPPQRDQIIDRAPRHPDAKK